MLLPKPDKSTALLITPKNLLMMFLVSHKDDADLDEVIPQIAGLLKIWMSMKFIIRIFFIVFKFV